MAYEITRNFTKRETAKSDWSGKIGEATLRVDANGFFLNGNLLSEQSVRHLLNFSLQTLQDAYAGSQSLSEARGAFDGKYDKLIDGTIGIRSNSGDGASEFERIARRLVLTTFKTNLGKDWKSTAKWMEFDALSDDAKEEKLDASFEKNRAHFEPMVKEEIARLEQLRKDKARMMSQAIVIDL
jgi:hypothetical protein